MKVALIAEWLDAWRGGAETSTLQFIHHLMDRGIELHLFTRSRPSPAPGLMVHHIGGASMSRTRRSVTFAHRVGRIIRSEPFDIVHAISPYLDADIYQPRGGTVAETIKRNLSLIDSAPARRLKSAANSLNFKQRYLLRMERSVFRPQSKTVIVAISDYVTRQLQDHYQLPAERICKIYNGVDPDPATDAERAADRTAIRSQYEIPESACLVLLIAHNFRLKGVARWMEAMHVLQQRGVNDVRSLIIGKGDTQRWHRLASKLRITQNLTLAGPTDRIRSFHHAADVLVHPTYYDPCSRVVLEGMVAGLPCITTKWDGAAEMIKDAKNGYVLDDPKNTTLLADRVMELRDRDRRAAVGREAARIADRVSMSRHAESMLALYEELIKRRKPRP